MPGSASKSLTSDRGRPSAAAVTALASGCSLFFSREAARHSRRSRSASSGRMSVTRGQPSVTVPVLSRAMIFVRPAPSRAAAVLYRIPFFAPVPLPTIMATGVARPRAQGQLMTSTEMARATEKAKERPAISHPASVRRARPITAGTKTAETRSAMRASGALVAAASETVRMICASVVSSPTRVARHSTYPCWLMVAAETALPSALSTGMLSPVRADSLTEVIPFRITPSTGICSPGRTTNTSPVRTSSMPTSVSVPSFSSTAVFGASRIRPFRASVVRPLDFASSILPMVINVGIMAADSKYRFIPYFITRSARPSPWARIIRKSSARE